MVYNLQSSTPPLKQQPWHLLQLQTSNTRGHAHKLQKQHNFHKFRKHFVTLRIVEAWNKQPASVVSSPDIIAFSTCMFPVIRQQYIKC